MRPRADSQAGRILALLETGGWWSTSELLREVPSIVHSRIAGLRDAGFSIEHRTTGQGAAHSLYRLVVASGAGTVEPSPASDGAPTGTMADARHDVGAPSASLPADEGTSRSVPSEAKTALSETGEPGSEQPHSTGLARSRPTSVSSSAAQLVFELPARLRDVA